MHLIEYAIEALCLGSLLVIAAIVTTIFQLPASPIHQAIADPTLRRCLIGIVMGLTVIAIVYSPFGKRSGAHLNPSVTLTYWRLKKVRTIDACFYMLAQCVGAISGIFLAGIILGGAIADPAVNYIVTIPKAFGELGAFLSEFLLSFCMMTMVLQVSNRPNISRFTGICAGVLVAIYIAIESPISGSSMNPARSLGSALPTHVWYGFWLYCVAPPLGMLTAAEVYLRTGKKKSNSDICSKLCPNITTSCISPICCQRCRL
jgi:aquaporin Z